MNGLVQDLRYALRQLQKNFLLTAIALTTLALGIAATTVIFSVVNGVLLRPLRYQQPEKLFVVREIVPELSQTYPSFPANVASFRTWQRECHSFDDIAIVKPDNMTLTGYGDPTQIPGGRASANILDVLGVRPAIGRTFFSQEDNPGNDRVVILSYSFWHERFHGDPTIVGRAITLDGIPFQVVGVLPAAFRYPRSFGPLAEFPERLDYLKPLGLDATKWSPFGDFDFAAVARLKPGVNPTRALAELNVVQANIAKSGNVGLNLRAQLIPLETQVVGAARLGLLYLLAGVGAVLLIVCLNLANLLLVRVPVRLREAGIRTALGASRSRLVRQMLTESTVLAVLGGIAGMALAYYGVRVLVALAPANLPRIDEVQIDNGVMWFGAVVSVLTGMIFGVLPAWRLTQSDPQQVLKAGATTTTESRSSRRLRTSLVGFEVGLGTLLLVVSGLLMLSMVRLLDVNKGFTTDHVLAADITLPPALYRNEGLKRAFWENVLSRVRSSPGVRNAAWISRLPLEGQEQVDNIVVPGRPLPETQAPLANYRFVTAEYFQTLNIPLIQGRLLEPADAERHVAVISASVAEKVWPGENPLGKQFRTGGDTQWPAAEVVGVVGDIRAVALDEAPLLMVYQPIGPGSPKWWGGSASLVVRSSLAPQTLSGAVRDAIHRADPGVPIVHLRPMTEIVSESVSVRRFELALASLFGVFALVLAALGIYGVVGYSVASRRQEMGIRIALGAHSSNLRRLILLQGMLPVVVGWAAGILAAVGSGFLIRSLLFGVSEHNPATIGCVSLVVLATALLACYIPARRAANVDPMVALRYE
jgi:putative ABC transport system permease protein